MGGGSLQPFQSSNRALGFLPLACIQSRGVHTRLIAERDENTCREEMDGNEKADLAIAIKPFEEKAAADRLKAAQEAGRLTQKQGKKVESQTVRESTSHAAESMVRTADAVGWSAPTLAKAIKVREAVIAAPKKNAEASDLLAVMNAVKAEAKVADVLPTREQAPGGRPKAGMGPKKTGYNITGLKGTSQSYLARRIRRDAPQVFENLETHN